MFFNINIKFILLFFLVRETQILLNYSNNFIINSLQKISKLKKNCITVRKPLSMPLVFWRTFGRFSHPPVRPWASPFHSSLLVRDSENDSKEKDKANG